METTTPTLQEIIREHAADWPTLREILLTWDYAAYEDDSPRCDPAGGDYMPKPGTWDDVAAAAYAGLIAWEHYQDVADQLRVTPPSPVQESDAPLV